MSVATAPWMNPHSLPPNLPFQHSSSGQNPSSYVPQRNEVELSREMLITILTHFSTLILHEFMEPIQLVVHGGACMLLHPDLHKLAKKQPVARTTTRDVDYIHRSFVSESAGRGFFDYGERLKAIIYSTAQYFKLGADWMNADADVALPMAIEYV